ncbi:MULTISPECIES: hypothetical protein [Gordonia]|uniref:hypothetical protein n=1 Tax=Gordonia TaxID=2053 RepID=UPI001E2A2F96|nr:MULTISPECIES: hypothetical protein [Gordonia]
MRTARGVKQPGPAVTRTALAAVVATLCLVVAVVVDLPVTSVLFAVAGAGVAIGLIGSLRRYGQKSALRGAAVVVATVLLVGLPTVAVLADPETASDSHAADGDAVLEGGGDPSAALARALDRADRLVPGGSSSIRQISIDDDRETVRVLDPRTGREIASYRSGTSWSDSDPARTGERTVFTRADVAHLDLNAAAARVSAARQKIGYPEPTSSGGIEIGPRSVDDKVVARFGQSGGESIETDLHGRVADTVGAASLSEFLSVAERVLKDEGIDPDGAVLRSIAYKAVDEAAPWIGVAHPGVELELDGGGIYRIWVQPGRFPELSETDSASDPDGFSLTGLTGATMVRIRDDLVRRHRVAAYDRDAVGLKIGVAPGDDDPAADRLPVTVQMQVGPDAVGATGVYSPNGKFLREGRR